MKGDIVCAVEPCMDSMEGEDESCVAQPAPPGECCPKEYKCGKFVLSALSLLSQNFILGIQNKTIFTHIYISNQKESLTFKHFNLY